MTDNTNIQLLESFSSNKEKEQELAQEARTQMFDQELTKALNAPNMEVCQKSKDLVNEFTQKALGQHWVRGNL